MPSRALLTMILSLFLLLSLPTASEAIISGGEVSLERRAEILSAFPFLQSIEADLRAGEIMEVFIVNSSLNAADGEYFSEERLVFGTLASDIPPAAWPSGTFEWYSYGELETLPAAAAARSAHAAYDFWRPFAPDLAIEYRGPIELEDPDVSDSTEMLFNGLNEVIFGTGPRDYAQPYRCGDPDRGPAGLALISTLGTHTKGGMEFRSLVETTFWIREGTDCISGRSRQALLSHEIGHTLGLRHSCGDPDLPVCDPNTIEGQATMHPFLRGGPLPRQWDQEQMALRHGPSTALPECPTAVSFSDVPLEIAVAWRRPDGTTGCAAAVGNDIAENSANLYFFRPENWEVALKGLDGCDVNGHLWFFAAGLTNLQTEITLTDWRIRTVRKYYTAPGEPFFPVQDVTAFRNCEL